MPGWASPCAGRRGHGDGGPCWSSLWRGARGERRHLIASTAIKRGEPADRARSGRRGYPSHALRAKKALARARGGSDEPRLDHGRRGRHRAPDPAAARRLSDSAPVRRGQDHAQAGEEFVKADLADQAAVEHLCAGVDGIIHLGASSVEDAWSRSRTTSSAATTSSRPRAARASSGRVRDHQPRRRLLPPPADHRPHRHGPAGTPATASARRSARRWPHVRRQIRPRRVQHPDRQSREEPVDRRRLSIWIARAICCSSCGSGSSIRGSTSRSSTASPPTPGWYDNANAHRLGYRPEDQAEDYAASATEADLKLPPTRSASSSRAAASAPWNSQATSKRFSNCT